MFFFLCGGGHTRSIFFFHFYRCFNNVVVVVVVRSEWEAKRANKLFASTVWSISFLVVTGNSSLSPLTPKKCCCIFITRHTRCLVTLFLQIKKITLSLCDGWLTVTRMTDVCFVKWSPKKNFFLSIQSRQRSVENIQQQYWNCGLSSRLRVKNDWKIENKE